ncbi:hypothetical protein SAMN05444172_2261 [Burkholderia sp. GAS332]|nr:hypothetical protein SAMN05444172_2261 [Burkholderia sp. GAS332]
MAYVEQSAFRFEHTLTRSVRHLSVTCTGNIFVGWSCVLFRAGFANLANFGEEASKSAHFEQFLMEVFDCQSARNQVPP